MSEIASLNKGWTPPQVSQTGRRVDTTANPKSSARAESSSDVQTSRETPKVQSGEKTPKTLSRWIKSGDLFAIGTRFKFDIKTQEIHAEIVDNRTGDVIMKIPYRDLVEMLSVSESRGNAINITA
jgi:uncharacterized FlaG/YvyC family protein